MRKVTRFAIAALAALTSSLEKLQRQQERYTGFPDVPRRFDAAESDLIGKPVNVRVSRDAYCLLYDNWHEYGRGRVERPDVLESDGQTVLLLLEHPDQAANAADILRDMEVK